MIQILKMPQVVINLLDMFTPSFNIKFVPNIVGFISIVSLFINRSEMWGIFIAKYNPNIFEFLLGMARNN